MPEKRSRFVLFCQQVLAFGTVIAVAAPAASVVDLDIVAPNPEAGARAGSAPRSAGSLVASEPVAPTITEESVRGVEKLGLQALTDNPRAQEKARADLAALSAPEPVDGYATVGVTWKHGEVIDDHDLTVSVRSLKDGEWSAWEELEYHDEHGPDPDSEEGRNARPGTDPIVVGEVDEVQVKAVTESGEAPKDMKVALIDPGETVGQTREQPAIDTAELSAAHVTTDDTATEEPASDPAATLVGTPAPVTPKPRIYSRKQWGANERMRDKSSLKYFEVHAGFVHHTVNSNNYTRAQVPALMRGIYAYHTQSRGWSDIGYNFIVDKFGRIWEGRYGGVARPVVGAHTLGYNEYSFAMSALGNFETAKPSAAVLNAYGRLMAWKLALHGVDAASTRQRVGRRTFRAINGHRDAGQTACPGRHLYAKLGRIRSLANGYQKPFGTRDKKVNMSGQKWPDLVVRDKVTKRAKVLRTDGGLGFRRTTAAGNWKGMDLITSVRDITGDGRSDMVARNRSTKETAVYPGDGKGRFGAAVRRTMRFAGVDQLTGAGDMNGDRKADMVGRNATSKRLYLYRGKGNGSFGSARLLNAKWAGYNLTTGVDDMTGDGKRDIVGRDSRGTLWVWRGNGRGRLTSRTALPGKWAGYDLIAGLGDVTSDGRSDIVGRQRRSKLTYVFPGNGRGGLRHWVGPFDDFRDVTYFGVAGNVIGGPSSDIVARAGGGNLVVLGNNGGRGVRSVVDTGRVFTGANLILNVGDWNGDRNVDVMTRSGPGNLWLYAGDGRNRLRAPVLVARGWRSVRLIAAVGDITGDGYPDLMGQPNGGSMRVYEGNGKTGFRGSYAAHSAVAATAQVGVGLWNADGSPDTVVRRSNGTLTLYPGNGPGGLTGGSKVGSGAARYDWVQGVGDADGDGDPDLIARVRSTGDLWLLPKQGAGFGTRQFLGENFSRYDLSSN